jgi:acetyl-CoA carboxylase biotin carboxyl carrier protein
MPSLDLELVKHALQVARQHGFAEVEIGHEGGSFRARLDAAPRSATPMAVVSAGEPASDEPQLSAIRATLVGYLQDRPEPLLVGQTVRQGEVVAVIAALGIANDVEAQVSGEVVEVLVKDGEPVQFGQVLATVRP